MIDGALPIDAAARDRFGAEVAQLASVPADLMEVLPIIARQGSPLNGLRTALSFIAHAEGMQPVLDIDHAQRRRDTLRLTAVTPVLLGMLWRLGRGEDPIEADPARGWAENYLRMVTGSVPTPAAAAALQCYLISTIDHGFNASTFTSRWSLPPVPTSVPASWPPSGR